MYILITLSEILPSAGQSKEHTLNDKLWNTNACFHKVICLPYNTNSPQPAFLIPGSYGSSRVKLDLVHRITGY